MPINDLDAVFFLREPPEITISDGMFHIGFSVGKECHIEVVVTPHTFRRMRKRGADALAVFEAGTKVVPFKKAKRAH